MTRKAQPTVMIEYGAASILPSLSTDSNLIIPLCAAVWYGIISANHLGSLTLPQPHPQLRAV